MSRRCLLAALTVGLLVAGCGGPPDPSPTAAAPERSAPPLHYVALGDSFTAAPLVPAVDGSSAPCVRSTGNYPALVADSLDAAGESVRLVDRSCVEARTADLFAPQTVGELTVPPQTRPLTRRTDLVTVGIGGNDVLTSLVGTCPTLRATDPTGAPCAAELGDAPYERLDGLRADLTVALRRVLRLAPRARVVVVGYPQTAPASGTCPARLPLADGDVAFARSVADRLDDALRGAAADAGAGFVDAYAASAGHDICSDEPWVNGRRTVRGALAYHPFATGQHAVADLVLTALRA